ncbi:MAG: riboflavin synthase [Rickettsiales bacterium]|jgi:riboflavin synthase|nr:riboflavin synthase [Rickettsiales bacterium]|tara:strand:+ start:998 stop:1591 length:594 start_codon:yes stop_codon:yes gene_type:complete
MFTGLITDVGYVRAVTGVGDRRIKIETSYTISEIELGASIACSGVCLTAVDFGESWFAVEASEETTSKTTAGDWQVGDRLNLERSLRIGDELGGHLVFGHVDGVARITERRTDGDSIRFSILAPNALAPYIASKGSVALNGVSLTVNEVDGHCFGVNIIPHTADATTFGKLAAGDCVNLEVDMLARYVARQLEAQKG